MGIKTSLSNYILSLYFFAYKGHVRAAKKEASEKHIEYKK